MPSLMKRRRNCRYRRHNAGSEASLAKPTRFDSLQSYRPADPAINVHKLVWPGTSGGTKNNIRYPKMPFWWSRWRSCIIVASALNKTAYSVAASQLSFRMHRLSRRSLRSQEWRGCGRYIHFQGTTHLISFTYLWALSPSCDDGNQQSIQH